MTDPVVTFIVPCYNLSHLLAECVNSILSQSFTRYEILIMDDCSPDNTPEVAQSFKDHRVIHIRNETNLRHLANYNKGVTLARGKYVWLISADDRLRSSSVLSEYVALMEDHPEVGYVFCPAVKLENGNETDVLAYSFHGSRNTIFRGHHFLEKLLAENSVVAASAMARKECYEKVGMFPLDMPYAGDWYLWCLFALYYDVAYFAEPMVCYRFHSQMTTRILKEQDLNILFYDDIEVISRIRNKAKDLGLVSIVDRCDECIVLVFTRKIVHNDNYFTSGCLSIDKYINIMKRYVSDVNVQAKLISQICYCIGDNYYWKGNISNAYEYYKKSTKYKIINKKQVIKLALTILGQYGVFIRNTYTHFNKIWKCSLRIQ